MKIKCRKKMEIAYAQEIYELMQNFLLIEPKLDQEHFWVIAMSTEKKILNLDLVAWGNEKRVNTQPVDVLSIPLQKQAAGVILVHNDPSGLLEISEEDKNYTYQMIQACRIMKIPVLDHVIITESSYMSFRENGLLEN